MKILGTNEIRKAYFLQAFGREVEDMQIISFGKCNYNCPYCKRDGQFKSGSTIINSFEMSMEELKERIDKAISEGRCIRLSGGDPCMFPNESLEIAKYIWNKYYQKVSVAHNGSSPEFIKMMLPYTKYLALDFKGASDKEINYRSNTRGTGKIEKIVQILDLCQNNILVDVRTPVFGDTTISSLDEMAELLSEYKNVFWTLRKYNEVQCCDFKECSLGCMKNVLKILNSRFPKMKIGMRDKWGKTEFIFQTEK